MNKKGLNFFLDSQSDTAAVNRIHSSPFLWHHAPRISLRCWPDLFCSGSIMGANKQTALSVITTRDAVTDEHVLIFAKQQTDNRRWGTAMQTA